MSLAAYLAYRDGKLFPSKEKEEAASAFSFILTGLIGLGLLYVIIFSESILEDIYHDGCKFIKEYAEDNYESVLEGIKNVYQYIKSKITAGYIAISGNSNSNELKNKRLLANN